MLVELCDHNGDSAGMEVNESKKPMKTLERVKRSGSEFPFEFFHIYQCLTTFGQFLCWTLC